VDDGDLPGLLHYCCFADQSLSVLDLTGLQFWLAGGLLPDYADCLWRLREQALCNWEAFAQSVHHRDHAAVTFQAWWRWAPCSAEHRPAELLKQSGLSGKPSMVVVGRRCRLAPSLIQT